MSNKEALTDFEGRCVDLVQNEGSLMDDWASELDAEMMIGRAAQCRMASNAISTGPGSPLWRVRDTAARAAASPDSDILHPPSDQQISKEFSYESDYRNRAKLDPAGLGDEAFVSNLIDSRGNATRSSNLADATLKSCTAA